MPGIRRRVIRPWHASYVPALAVTAGQAVIPGRTDPDNPGWQWVETEAGLGGWVPQAIVDGARVTEDFDTREITVGTAKSVEVIERRLGWAWVRTDNGQEGWLPETCLR